MEVIHQISFYVEESEISLITDFFNQYDISLDKPVRARGKYKFIVPIQMNNQIDHAYLENMYSNLKIQFHINRIGEKVYFIFNHQDYEHSPIFHLKATGNSRKATLQDKGTNMIWKTLCSTCDLKYKEQLSPLVINTGDIEDRFMVNVDHDYWVISEDMASLMKEWEVTGYRLAEVIHKGEEVTKQPAYQLIPTNTLPSWSSQMRADFFVSEDEKRRQCPVCGIRGRINFPYHYDNRYLDENICDVNVMKEWNVTGHANGWAYHPTFFSRRFRELLIKHNITREVRSVNSRNYKSKDWVFDPIQVVMN